MAQQVVNKSSQNESTPISMEEWAKNRKPVPQYPQKMQVGVRDGYCNLKCPMCLAHSSDLNHDLEKGGHKGEMSFETLMTMLTEVQGNRPTISPNRWSEPLMIRDFAKHIKAFKAEGFPIILNTNGLSLTRELAQLMVDVEFEAISFSIDATTPETLKKVRGIEKLDKIKKNIFMLLEVRGQKAAPRIGVSFTVQKENEHEKEDFWKYWIQYVDSVRIAQVYEFDYKVYKMRNPEGRVPCDLLYSTMVVDWKGDVTPCCLDPMSTTNMGNVLKDNIEKVWHGPGLEKMRYQHETGQFDKIPICKDCGVWANFNFNETVKDGILIRESPVMIFYNRIDRLNNWKIK